MVCAFTPFGTCTLAIEDELTLEEQKRENERKRYHDMDGLARSERIIKIIESCKQRNIENQGMIYYLYQFCI
jgi:flagellar biosynthesis/type III secretory pathway chaperone